MVYSEGGRGWRGEGDGICVCVCACVYVCVCVCVCVVSVIVKLPVLPPCVVDGRSRNPLYYNYYYHTVVTQPNVLKICRDRNIYSKYTVKSGVSILMLGKPKLWHFQGGGGGTEFKEINIKKKVLRVCTQNSRAVADGDVRTSRPHWAISLSPAEAVLYTIVLSLGDWFSCLRDLPSQKVKRYWMTRRGFVTVEKPKSLPHTTTWNSRAGFRQLSDRKQWYWRATCTGPSTKF